MFHPNIPMPGRREQNPIVIADDSSDSSDSSNDIIPEEDEQEDDQYQDQIEEEDSDDDLDHDTDSDEMELDYSLHSRPRDGIMGFAYPTTPTTHLGPTLYQATLEQERRLRTRLREERHAALCVLLDRELLTIQALAAQETLPQCRRRFLSRLLAPEDPESAASIRADRFTVQHAHPSTSSGGFSASSAAMIVPRRVVDVYETDDAGWRRPERGVRGGGGGGCQGSGMQSSPGSVGSGSGSSAKMKGRMGTPDRVGRGTRGRGLQSSSYRERDRERERERRRGLF
ncbi:hypothetical protein BO94DRAFT_574345 [Aspergillus sclerotioniger CBS 115572]|uniref:Uncharacterized protein n=1 Tax=Aspergillus sclerotioniger CBS 115572 TaxID=1450535 RepID=A0A317WU60_9EURO|nr:hypothetical protein BO94DRAFT_574345 [Aspergillus sclerotioniger CBS 115572]PWY89361.1 hypothetical protein BO94DRAFT_574345 [Aspergillus sclerotioniger CBS 115572]